MVPLARRIRSTKTRASGTKASASTARSPTVFPPARTLNARSSHLCQAEPAPPMAAVPPCIFSYSLQAATRSMRMRAGQTRAITMAEPTVPNM